MYAKVEKPKGNKSRAVANSVAQKRSGGDYPFQFVDNRPEAIKQRKLQKMTNNSSKSKKVAQRAPAAQGFLGADETFLRQALNFTIMPTRVRMRDEGEGGTLFMIDFPPEYQCQIHIHEAFDGQINGAHIKSNVGNIRHGMNYVDAILYLGNLNTRAVDKGQFLLEQM